MPTRHAHRLACAGRGERLGLGAATSADPSLGDVYSSYRRLRSDSYHEMIVRGGGQSNTARGGGK